jgi:predicted amidohydrolase
MKIKVAACQQALDQPFSTDQIEKLRNYHPDFVCLPEHYPLPKEVMNLQEAADLFETRKQYLHDLSIQVGSILIGGTLTESAVEGFYNTCYIFDSGEEIGFYRKVNPTSREQEAGVLKGDQFKIFELRGIRTGVLICADVLYESSFQEMSSLQCEIVFIPTASPFRPGESIDEKFARDRFIFVEGARKLNCPVVKVCGVGTTFGHPIQGRSLIAMPDGILKRAEPREEQTSLIFLEELEIR